MWVLAGDEVRLRFLTAAGLRAGRRARTLDTGRSTLAGDGSATAPGDRLVASLAGRHDRAVRTVAVAVPRPP